MTGVPPFGAIAAGPAYACAVTATGARVCWGSNAAGAFGDGTTTTTPSPRFISGLSASASVAGALGAYHSCLVRTDGRLACAGRNDEGQLGDGTFASRSTFMAIGPIGITEISASALHTCAIRGLSGGTVGELYCWGDNGFGQLGFSSPMRSGALLTDLTSTNVHVAAGGRFTCVVRDPMRNEVRCAGENSHGVLGVDPVSMPSRGRFDVAVTFAVGRTVSALYAGPAHACARLDDNSLWCWGSNDDGELGDGTFVARTSPVRVLTNVRSASVGGLFVPFVSDAPRFAYSCAVLLDGTMRCWGSNHAGQLGRGLSVADLSRPARLAP